MIYLYTRWENDENWIMKNDWYFNLYTGNQEFTAEEKELILQVDHANVLPDKRIETPYGLGNVRNLSSGCKTLLNILKNPDKVMNVDECGKNVLDIIFQLENIHIYMNRPERIDIASDKEILIDRQEVVVGKSGYEKWWSREYDRRRQDDL